MRQRYIVTGGAGFIGGHLVRALIQEGYDVIVIDNFLTGRKENLSAGAAFIEGDISDPKVVGPIRPENVKGVFHLAAQSSGEISFECPDKDFKTNVYGTFLMLEWCRRHNIKDFIYSSSMSVYGDVENNPIREDAPLLPKSFYGVGKLHSENYIKFYRNFGINGTILRLFNVYGPMQNLDNLKQGMASIYMSYVLKDDPIIVKGSMDRFRDQTYVSDCVEAMMLCIKNPVARNKTYNISTGKPTTVKELITSILKAGGRAPDHYPLEVKEATKGDVFGTYADVGLARRELGWSAKIGLDKGIKNMFDHYTNLNSTRRMVSSV